MKHHGSVEDSVSMMKVPNGEIFYGSSDIDYDDGYWTGDNVRRNYVVIGVSDGHSSYQRSKDKIVSDLFLRKRQNLKLKLQELPQINTKSMNLWSIA